MASNYGDKKDTDQFRGWSHQGGPATKKQWNSCTTNKEEFRAQHYAYYNANHWTTQSSPVIVTHGTMTYRTFITPCPSTTLPLPVSYPGCQLVGGSFSQTSNHMTLYELDQRDDDELVETLYFPGTSVALTGCTYDGCPEQTSDWVEMTWATEPLPIVEAELRMKVSARLEGLCDWYW